MAAKFTYDALVNENVKFLQGTQADLNKYLPDSSDTNKGKAEEGAFYLTTDTHRLYVGRKVSTVPNPNPYKVAEGDVYPEEVSTGIATVASTGQLAQAATGGAAHDGDFYYIKDSNVLAVYEENEDGTSGGSWQQINSPTGIGNFSVTVASNTPQDNLEFNNDAAEYVRVTESIQPLGIAEATTSNFWLKAGDNITLKPSTNNRVIEISSANSQSTLSVINSTADTNKAPVILSDNINLDTKVSFIGASDTTTEASYKYNVSTDTSVNSQKTYYTRTGTDPNYTYTEVTNPTGNPSTSSYYERENIITITGPGVQGTNITALGTAGDSTTQSGFNVAIQVKNGATNTDASRMLGENKSKLDPVIVIGKNSTIETKFHGGKANLDVYSADEVDTKISQSITNALQVTDALHYKGLVGNITDLNNLDNGTTSIGDVYKASAVFAYNGITIKVGDLLIAKGDEYAISSDTSVNTSKTYYTRSGSAGSYIYTKVTSPSGDPHSKNYYEFTGVIAAGGTTWEIVPSGDEPLLVGTVRAGSIPNNIDPGFGLEDQNIAAAYNDLSNDAEKLAKRPLFVSIDNANSTLIKASSTGTSADDYKIRLHHQVPDDYASAMASTSAGGRTETTNIFSNDVNSTNDSIGSAANKEVTFQAISSIERDAYGHILKIKGDTITLKHNYLTQFNTSHTIDSNNNKLGIINISAQDIFGFSNNATAGQIKIGSDTLIISAPNNDSQLNINLQWQSF